MSLTLIDTTHALRVTRWEALLWKYPLFKSFFSPYIGDMEPVEGGMRSDPNAMIQIRGDFMKQKGDKVVFGLRAPLSATGIAADGTLEGNEEALTFYDFDVELKQIRHAVRQTGELDDKRVMFELAKEASEALGEWMARKIDKNVHCALAGIASADANVVANAPKEIIKKIIAWLMQYFKEKNNDKEKNNVE